MKLSFYHSYCWKMAVKEIWIIESCLKCSCYWVIECVGCAWICVCVCIMCTKSRRSFVKGVTYLGFGLTIGILTLTVSISNPSVCVRVSQTQHCWVVGCHVHYRMFAASLPLLTRCLWSDNQKFPQVSPDDQGRCQNQGLGTSGLYNLLLWSARSERDS